MIIDPQPSAIGGIVSIVCLSIVYHPKTSDNFIKSCQRFWGDKHKIKSIKVTIL